MNIHTIEKRPERIQTIRAMLTLPVCMRTPVGETKMPEPMIDPTMTVHPFNRLILAFSPTSPPPSPPPVELASPFAEDCFLDAGFLFNASSSIISFSESNISGKTAVSHNFTHLIFSSHCDPNNRKLCSRWVQNQSMIGRFYLI